MSLDMVNLPPRLRAEKCRQCGGATEDTLTDQSITLDGKEYLVQNVPAVVCVNGCGAEPLTARGVARRMVAVLRMIASSRREFGRTVIVFDPDIL